MKYKINPIVDCVFKAILGKEENKNLLIHFLNAVLELEEGSLIQNVTILNPYNDREYIGGKLSVVDVKAVDENKKKYQVEIQIALHASFEARILYTWSRLYHSQIKEGDGYEKLKPVISIWILNQNLFKDFDKCHIRFSLYSHECKGLLTDHLGIHVLQLQNCHVEGAIKNEKERWVYLFKEGKNVDPENPPEVFNTKEMRQVMKEMNRFSESQRDYLMYQSRLEAILERNTWLNQLERAEKEKELAVKEKELAVKEAVKEALKEAAKEKDKAVKEAVREALKKAGKEKDEAAKEKEKFSSIPS